MSTVVPPIEVVTAPAPGAPAAPAGRRPRFRLTRRRVLGGALAGGLGVAGLRLAGLDQEVGQLLHRAVGRGTDWISPLAYSERARLAHLLRRTTFGATPLELERAVSDGYDRTVDRLLETPPAPPPAFARAVGDPRLNIQRLMVWWVDHMLASPTPFAERMTLFWHGHFTSDFQKVGLQQPFIYWQNLTWREMALTDLRSMLMRVTSDPAMLRYLDLGTSTGANPNENYSRELMELFTLGVGNYSEDDVRASARALAGWTFPRPDGSQLVTLDGANQVTRRYPTYQRPKAGVFIPRRAYDYAADGPLTFLRRTGRFDARGVLDQILDQPATAALITRKLVEHFVTGQPDDGYIRRLADQFRSSRYDVKTLLRAVFTSPEFLADQSYRALVKAPIEFGVNVLKALAAPQLSRLVVAFSRDMGQILFDPPDVSGWPNNEAWISSNTVVSRVNLVTTALGQLKTVPAGSLAPQQLDSVLSGPTAAALDAAVDDHSRWFLTLAAPEFQLK